MTNPLRERLAKIAKSKETEIWKPVPGYKNLEASSLGRVRTTLKDPPHIKAQYLNQSGYPVVSISKGCGRPGSERVHRLVAKAFGIISPGDHVNHMDGVKANNRLDNLEASNHDHNLAHAWRLGLMKPAKGDGVASSKVTEKQAIEILKRYYSRTSATQRQLAKEFGVWSDTIGTIVRGSRWKHLDGLRSELKKERAKYCKRGLHDVRSMRDGICLECRKISNQKFRRNNKDYFKVESRVSRKNSKRAK